MINIKICTPCYNEALYNESQAKKSLSNIKDAPFLYSGFVAYGTRISALRNALVNNNKSQLKKGQKLDETFTHWLFIDSDINYTQNDIVKLLVHDKDIVSGAYISKSNPDNFEAGVTDQNGRNISYVSSKSTGLNKIDGYVGLGFMLLKREALEIMEYPYFSEYVICYTKEGNNGEIAEVFAEDAYFCKNAKDNGLEIYLDCECKVDHIF
jgi:hypothetical protein